MVIIIIISIMHPCSCSYQGYLRSLGMARTAQVKRDARIGEAEARRDATIRVNTAAVVVVSMVAVNVLRIHL